MLALAMREAAECRRCGGDLTETTNYDYRWDPEPPIVCLRCVALHTQEHDYRDHADKAGLIYQVKRVLRSLRRG